MVSSITLPLCRSRIAVMPGWLVGWGLTALLTQIRSYRACCRRAVAGVRIGLGVRVAVS